MQGDRVSELAGKTTVVHHPQFPDVAYQVTEDKVSEWTDQGWIVTEDEAVKASAHPVALVSQDSK